MKGKIITIEGIDGSGKSTQISMLSDYFKDKGIGYKFIHYPRLSVGVYGNLIAEYLRGELGSLENVNPKLVALLFAEDRRYHLKEITSWLNDGNVILMDRYVNSNIAFQCSKVKDFQERHKLKNWILNLEFNVNGLYEPTISFFLDVHPSAIEDLKISDRTGNDREYLKGKNDIHEESLELQKNVYDMYVSLCNENKDFHSIRSFDEFGNRVKPETINDLIIKHLEVYNKLSNKTIQNYYYK